MDVKQIAKKRILPPHRVETVLSEEEDVGKAPRLADEKFIANLMAAHAPGALANVQLQLGAPDLKSNRERSWNNPHTGPIGKALGAMYGRGDENREYNPMEEMGGPYFHPLYNTVVNPWRAPGATVHELGHAIDFNERPVAKTWLGRQIKGTMRDAYMLAPGTTLWKEHAAWRKGLEALQHGGAKKQVDIAKIRRIIEKSQHAKYPALGTYWGATLGTGAGLLGSAGLFGAALASNDDALIRASIRLSGLGPLVGGALGIVGGLGIGTRMRDTAKAKALAQLDKEYPELMAKYKQQAHTDQAVSKSIRKAASRLARAKRAGFFNKLALDTMDNGMVEDQQLNQGYGPPGQLGQQTGQYRYPASYEAIGSKEETYPPLSPQELGAYAWEQAQYPPGSLRPGDMTQMHPPVGYQPPPPGGQQMHPPIDQNARAWEQAKYPPGSLRPGDMTQMHGPAGYQQPAPGGQQMHPPIDQNARAWEQAKYPPGSLKPGDMTQMHGPAGYQAPPPGGTQMHPPIDQNARQWEQAKYPPGSLKPGDLTQMHPPIGPQSQPPGGQQMHPPIDQNARQWEQAKYPPGSLKPGDLTQYHPPIGPQPHQPGGTQIHPPIDQNARQWEQAKYPPGSLKPGDLTQMHPPIGPQDQPSTGYQVHPPIDQTARQWEQAKYPPGSLKPGDLTQMHPPLDPGRERPMPLYGEPGPQGDLQASRGQLSGQAPLPAKSGPTVPTPSQLGAMTGGMGGPGEAMPSGIQQRPTDMPAMPGMGSPMPGGRQGPQASPSDFYPESPSAGPPTQSAFAKSGPTGTPAAPPLMDYPARPGDPALEINPDYVSQQRAQSQLPGLPGQQRPQRPQRPPMEEQQRPQRPQRPPLETPVESAFAKSPPPRPAVNGMPEESDMQYAAQAPRGGAYPPPQMMPRQMDYQPQMTSNHVLPQKLVTQRTPEMQTRQMTHPGLAANPRGMSDLGPTNVSAQQLRGPNSDAAMQQKRLDYMNRRQERFAQRAQTAKDHGLPGYGNQYDNTANIWKDRARQLQEFGMPDRQFPPRQLSPQMPPRPRPYMQPNMGGIAKTSAFAAGFIEGCVKQGLSEQQIVKVATIVSKTLPKVALRLEPITKQAGLGSALGQLAVKAAPYADDAWKAVKGVGPKAWNAAKAGWTGTTLGQKAKAVGAPALQAGIGAIGGVGIDEFGKEMWGVDPHARYWAPMLGAASRFPGLGRAAGVTAAGAVPAASTGWGQTAARALHGLGGGAHATQLHSLARAGIGTPAMFETANYFGVPVLERAVKNYETKNKLPVGSITKGFKQLGQMGDISTDFGNIKQRIEAALSQGENLPGKIMGGLQAGWHSLTPAQQNMLLGGGAMGGLGLGAYAMGHRGLGLGLGAGGLGLAGAGLVGGVGDAKGMYQNFLEKLKPNPDLETATENLVGQNPLFQALQQHYGDWTPGERYAAMTEVLKQVQQSDEYRRAQGLSQGASAPAPAPTPAPVTAPQPAPQPAPPPAAAGT